MASYYFSSLCYFTCHGRSVDWWALGIVCFELMTGWPPFFDKDFEQMSQKILMKPLRFPSKYGIRPEAQVMIRSLLERDPVARLPCCRSTSTNGDPSRGVELFKHLPFFHNLDWDAIETRVARPPFLPPITGAFDDTSNFDKEFTDINVSIVSIEGATICKYVSDEGSEVQRTITTTVIKGGKSITDLRKESNSAEGEVYKDFNFFDPSFRQSYLTGNASLLPDSCD